MCFRPLLLIVTLTTSGLALGCASRSFVPAQTAESVAEGKARITLREVDGDVFKLTIFNLSNETLQIDRDAVRLQTPTGIRERRSGGVTTRYLVPPHGAHDVNVRFGTAGLVGVPIEVTFGGAVTVAGEPVGVAPIPIVLP